MEATAHLSQARMSMEEQGLAVKYLAALSPTITKVLLGVRYCEVYELSASKEWTDIETSGSLYVLEQRDDPRYLLLVASKQNLKTLRIPIDGGMKLQKAVDPSIKLHVLYVKCIVGGEEKTYCINFETIDIVKEAFSLVESLNFKEGRQSKDVRRELADVLKVLSADEEFVDYLAERVAKLRPKAPAEANPA